MDKSFCFSSFVFGSYQKYIPYYIYSIWKIYPTAFIKIFIEKSLDSNINAVLKTLNESEIKNFEIIELNTSFDEYEVYKMKGSGAKTLIRWLFGYEYFKDFEYVYIGDIDIFFLPEKISILDFHLKQMEMLNLPFSNKVRVDKNGNLTDRLTGLHFFQTKEYFDKIEPIISQIENDKYFRDEYLKDIERNENFLYKINKQAFNFDEKLVSQAERPWHGLHLGITRGNKNVDVKVIKENSSLTIEAIKHYLKEYSKDPIFREIQDKVFVVELEVILKELLVPYSFVWKLMGIKYRLTHTFRAFKKELKAFLR
jgi:hypothetical protein